jgi:DNA-binding GntR family transcriptional regulator
MKSSLAYEKVRDLILSGRKLPGTRLVLSELEAELKISKGPLREALIRLDRSGLVHNMPYKGCVVTAPPTFDEMQIIYEFRVELECRLAREAMRRITRKQITHLENIVKSSMNITHTGREFYTNNKFFHLALCECSGMSHLCLTANRLLEIIEVFLNLYRHEALEYNDYNNGHLQILKALKDKNEEEMEAALRRNIRDGMDLVSKVYHVQTISPRPE